MLLGIHNDRFLYRRFVSFAWLAFVLLLTLTVKSERLPVKTYAVADGLPRDFVAKIKQDSHGFLWFCTAGGVSRFDGYAFTNFTVADGLPDRHVNDFLETQSGEIWLATDAGLVKLNPKGVRAPFNKNQNIENPFFSVFLPANPKSAAILVLFETKAGRIFAGTHDGLYKLNERSEPEAVNLIKPAADFLEITSLLEDRRGNLWIGTFENGLLRLAPDGKVEQFTMADGLPGKNIETLLEDKDGRIWVGMRAGLGAGLCLLVREPDKNQKVVERIYTVNDGLPAEWITSLLQTGDGQMWVGTIKGLCKWQSENSSSVCKTYTADHDLTDTEIWALTEDKDGNLWAGTRIGAKKLARYGFTTYADADGIDTAFLNSIFENAAGELFTSADPGNTRTVSRFNGEKFDLVKPKFPADAQYFGSGENQTVWQDGAGDWWFPSGVGLYRFPRPAQFEDLTKIAPEKILAGGNDGEIFRLFEDSRGDFWISTFNKTFELWRWERAADVWHDYTKQAGVSANRIGAAFVEDRSGHLWIGTIGADNVLIRFDYSDGQIKIFTETEGFPPQAINDLFVDGKGQLWIAGSISGSLKLSDVNADNLTFVRYSTNEGLATQGALCVTEDKFGRIYIGTARGLDRLTPETGQIENFTTADGLPNSFIQMSYRDRLDNLWFITKNGLARFVPEPPRTRQPPNIFITGLRVSGVSQLISILGETSIPTLELDSDQRQITVDFLGLGTNPGEKLEYEYRFGESVWTQTSERTVNFANLSAGEYYFEVRAQTADKIYSNSPATVSFKIASPIWQRWWFLLLAVLAIAVITYLIYKNRLRRLIEMEKVRTRIATDLHDDIGANLTRISLLSEVAKQTSENGNSKLLTSIADIARESVASMNDIVWAISPDHDSLLDLVRRMRRHAEELFALRDIELEFDAPTDDTDLKLSVGVRRDLLLIFKEAVNNAAKHSECSRIKIDFRMDKAVIFLRIQDDGQGFDPTNSEGDGQGLRSMSRRASALGGELNIDSHDGTMIELRLPLQKIISI